MFRTVMLAVDDSKHSLRAAEVAKDLAEATDAAVVVVHVHQIAIGPWGRLRLDPSTKDDFVATIASELRCAGIQARMEIREVNYREVSEAIVDTADEIDADLIVVGSRGHSEIAAMPLGSVSHKLLHISHRPVLVVPAI
jgi:nucleotide-binding universal stress UspA family protein